MKTSAIALAALLAAGIAAPALTGQAFADDDKDRAGPDWISMEQAKQKAKDAGYSEVSKMEADDGHWEGEGVKNGKRLEFHMDPKTGAISDEHPDD